MRIRIGLVGLEAVLFHHRDHTVHFPPYFSLRSYLFIYHKTHRPSLTPTSQQQSNLSLVTIPSPRRRIDFVITSTPPLKPISRFSVTQHSIHHNGCPSSQRRHPDHFSQLRLHSGTLIRPLALLEVVANICRHSTYCTTLSSVTVSTP
jgi:hypothetical protein